MAHNTGLAGRSGATPDPSRLRVAAPAAGKVTPEGAGTPSANRFGEPTAPRRAIGSPRRNSMPRGIHVPDHPVRPALGRSRRRRPVEGALLGAETPSPHIDDVSRSRFSAVANSLRLIRRLRISLRYDVVKVADTRKSTPRRFGRCYRRENLHGRSPTTGKRRLSPASRITK